MTGSMTNVDVLIVGGGPTGLMMALELAIQNISFRIVDKVPIRSDKSRALAVQPRTLEVLNRHGLAEEFIDKGRIPARAHIQVNRRSVLYIELENIGNEDTEYRSPLFISQADTENFLDGALQRHGFAVERPINVESIEEDDQGVTVSYLRANDTKEQIRCKYVVGCDGARSIVRRAGNISFEGSSSPQDFILADVICKWDQPVDSINIFLGDGVLIVFPLKGNLVRLVASRPNSDNEGPEPTLTEFQDLLAKLAPEKAEISDATWLTRFRNHHRCVDKYRSGRLFVAGDAAHIHSPAGGQGMNTGMQDAVNLGWKLGQVLRGEKDDSLLDTYDKERRPVGEKLVQRSDHYFTFITRGSPFFVFLRNFLVPWVLPWLMGNPERRRNGFRFITQLNIRYRRSLIVGTSPTYVGPLFGGDRAPDGEFKAVDGGISTLHGLLVGPSHHLLLFSGTGDNAVDESASLSAAKEFLNRNSGWVTEHYIASSVQSKSAHVDSEGTLHTRYGFHKPGFVLVRPDGHVAYIGLLEGMQELASFVER